jgi:hypothetical protein
MRQFAVQTIVHATIQSRRGTGPDGPTATNPAHGVAAGFDGRTDDGSRPTVLPSREGLAQMPPEDQLALARVANIPPTDLRPQASAGVAGRCRKAPKAQLSAAQR